MEIHKDDFKVVPTCVRVKLDFKYWGERSLFKIVGGLGKPVKVDLATKNRNRLGFARILIEMNIDHEYPDQTTFINENGIEVCVDIEYEWKPIKCAKCHLMGHNEKECRKVVEKPRVQKVWIPKGAIRAPAEKGEEVGSDEFVRPSNVVIYIAPKVTKGEVENTYASLAEHDPQEPVVEIIKENGEEEQVSGLQDRRDVDKGGGNLPIPNE